MVIGSAYFNDYTRTLRRVYWAELVDRQMRERRKAQFRASLVGDPYAPRAAPHNHPRTDADDSGAPGDRGA